MAGSTDSVPSSFRSAFPFVAKSKAMRNFRSHVLSGLEAGNISPIVVGENRLEFNSFIAMLAKQMDIGRQEIAVISGQDMVSGAIEGICRARRFKLVVFMRGDRLPLYSQLMLMEHMYPCPKIVAVVPKHAEMMVAEESEGSIRWSIRLLDICSRTSLWPLWSRRSEDHQDLLDAMIRRLSMPNSRPVPRFHPSAMDYLMSSSFKGTDRAEAEIKGALTRYIKNGDIGDLAAEHFVTPEMLQMLSSARRRPACHDSQPPEPAF